MRKKSEAHQCEVIGITSWVMKQSFYLPHMFDHDL